MVTIAFRHSSAPAILLKDGCAVAKQQLHDIWETSLRGVLTVAPSRTEQDELLFEFTFYGDMVSQASMT